ncbi:MAG: 16S rRNA (guanine(966)-N(2))-methyltransferase RsmD [Rubricoccaceae bacterium]|nr:16S rRNA (guanine(966)-N(2))-methyltransferase RsmD [Rubricoccaceae bacterium]
MRIVGGEFRSRRLHVPKGGDVRPTTDRVRESVFNVVDARFDMDGASVLDLFAGTGALGLEALSRGGAHCTFVEQSRTVADVLRRNIAMLDVAERTRVVVTDVFKWLTSSNGAVFDLIFADPPYDAADAGRLPEIVEPCLAQGGLFVLEHDASRSHDFADRSSLVLSRAYGRTVVSIFCKSTG